LLGGLVALPGTAPLYWQSSDALSLGSVLIGGLIAGHRYDGGRANSRRSAPGPA
jgi:hypothetical protein